MRWDVRCLLYGHTGVWTLDKSMLIDTTNPRWGLSVWRCSRCGVKLDSPGEPENE